MAQPVVILSTSENRDRRPSETCTVIWIVGLSRVQILWPYGTCTDAWRVKYECRKIQDRYSYSHQKTTLSLTFSVYPTAHTFLSLQSTSLTSNFFFCHFAFSLRHTSHFSHPVSLTYPTSLTCNFFFSHFAFLTSYIPRFSDSVSVTSAYLSHFTIFLSLSTCFSHFHPVFLTSTQFLSLSFSLSHFHPVYLTSLFLSLSSCLSHFHFVFLSFFPFISLPSGPAFPRPLLSVARTIRKSPC